MKNGNIIKFVLVLFCLLPCTVFSQGVVQCEYWFDGEIGNMVVSKMNGGETYEIVSKVPTAQLDDGIHQFNFRIMQSDGKYSPVLTRVFFKSAASNSSILEYWFDDNYANRSSKELTTPDEDGNVGMSLDLSDNTKFPMGNHRLNLRVTNSHGMSVVHTASVLKLMSGKVELLEYWLDGDNTNVGYVNGKTADGGKDFLEKLDLSKTSEGVHRLYYRGVSASGESSTAIASVPVMVKPRQNFAPEQQKVVNYSVAVDNESPKTYQVADPQAEISQPYILKNQALKEGNHKVTVKAWNTAGAGVSTTQIFKVGKAVPPKLELTATVEGGIVFLDLNTIPGGQDYEICKVVRSRHNPTQYVPVFKGQQVYPKYSICYDIPDKAGSYEYIGRCWHYNSNNEKDTLQSKEVSAWVDIADKDRDKLGYIFGEIMTPVSKLACVELYDQNGTYIHQTPVDIKTNTFKTNVFPVGTVLTLKVFNEFDERFLYKNETVTIKPGRNDITMYGMKVDGAQPSNEEADLYFDDYIYEPNKYFKIKLKNLTLGTWKGLICARFVRKADDKNFSAWNYSYNTDKNQQLLYGDQGQYEWGVNETKEVTIPLSALAITKTEDYNIYFETVESPSNERKRIGLYTQNELNLISNPISNPMTRKLEKNIDGYKNNVELAVEMTDLALATMMLKSDYFDERLGNLREFRDIVEKGIKNAQQEIEFDEAEKQWMAKLDANIFSDAYPYEALVTMVDEHYNGQTHEELKGLSRVISNELRKRPEVLRFISEQRLEIQLALQDMLGDAYHWGAGVAKAYEVWNDIKDYYNKVKNLFGEITEYNRMDSHTKFFYKTRIFIKAADKVMGLATPAFAPFAKVLQNYMDIAEHTVNYALDNENYKYQFEEAWLLQNNKQDGVDYSYHYKNKLNVNFFVQIQTPYFSDWSSSFEHMSFFDFTKEEAQRQIMDVKIILSNNKSEAYKYDVIYCKPIFTDTGFYLETGEYVSGGGIGNIGDPLTRLWMEIKWRNGRTTLIPLKTSKGVTLTTVGGPCYNVIFESDSTNPERMADVIYLVGDKEDNKN